MAPSLQREAEDIALLGLAAVMVPATWRLLLGWSWPDCIPGHDGIATVFLAIRELVEAKGRWADLAYRAELRRQGMVVVNGPFDEQSDPSYRGMSIFACDPAEAARLSDGDPSVVAGRLAYDVMEWWVGAGSLAFPLTDRPVGDRRSMPDD